MPATIELINNRNGFSLGKKIAIASTFKQRLVGLLGRSRLDQEEGLLLERCNQVHMFFMRFEIGVLFLSPELRIVSIEPRLKLWTVSCTIADASCALELPLGVLESAECQIGDLLRVANT